MIIAILKDRKGFRKSIILSRPMRELKIPLRPFIPEIYRPSSSATTVPPKTEILEFEFYKELEKGKVFLFKEK